MGLTQTQVLSHGASGNRLKVYFSGMPLASVS